MKNMKLCFLFTIRSQDDWKWISHYNKDFNSFEFQVDKINISEELDSSKLTWYNIYYVAWGNTYYILDRLRKTWIDKVLVNEIKQDKLYIWKSAWATILWKSIEITKLCFDDNDINLKDLKWLNILDKEILPHFDNEWVDMKEYDKYKVGKNIVTLANNEALFISWNDEFRIFD